MLKVFYDPLISSSEDLIWPIVAARKFISSFSFIALIIAFVSLKKELQATPLLREELRNYVAEKLGFIAKPDELNFLDEVPKLESKKIDRHLLREKAMEGTPKLKGKDASNFRILER